MVYICIIRKAPIFLAEQENPKKTAEEKMAVDKEPDLAVTQVFQDVFKFFSLLTE